MPDIKEPNWSKEPKFTSKLPSSNAAGKIPPRTHIKEFKGLPASTQPRPLNIDKGK